MKRLLTMFSTVLVFVGLTAGGAAAAGGFVIPIDTVIVAEAGSLTVLAVATTPPELVGATCIGLAVAENQFSVHPNNDIIIETGGTSGVLKDVEGSPNKVTDALGPLTLGSTVKLTLSMGGDGIFSGGLDVFIDATCTPPTTTTTVPPTTTTTTVPPTTTTTTVPPTTTTPGVAPVIEIIKEADPLYYGNDGIGHFTIAVHNPGPTDLTEVVVTDNDALAVDPNSDCPRQIGFLGVDQTVTYACSIANLDGVSPFLNEATATGKGPNGQQVIATDDATVFPPVMDTTITTQPPATTEAPGETLPVTGINGDQMQGIGMAALIMVLSGIALLGSAAVIGQQRQDR